MKGNIQIINIYLFIVFSNILFAQWFPLNCPCYGGINTIVTSGTEINAGTTVNNFTFYKKRHFMELHMILNLD
jgi:hypothetical protein